MALLDPKDLVTLADLALSNMWETSALVELLERKGILTKQDVLAMIQELRHRRLQGGRGNRTQARRTGDPSKP